MNQHLSELLDTENEYIRKLNEIVLNSIEEEKLISQKLFQLGEAKPTFRERLEDTVSTFGGSWSFIFLCLALMVGWMVVNYSLLRHPVDPYPFILLNLALSTVAALQAPIIMMSQNRKEDKDRQRASGDYMVNLKAEIEVRNLHQKLDLLMAVQMKNLFEIQKAQVEIMEEIRACLLGREQTEGAL